MSERSRRRTVQVGSLLAIALGLSACTLQFEDPPPYDPHADTDEDGLTNAEEDRLGTDPYVADSDEGVRVVEHLPATKDTYGSNYCDITVRLVRGQIVAFGCIDNLVKGASGAAVQNFNLMYGFPEALSL